MALQFLLVVALLACGEPVAAQTTDMHDTTDESPYATASDTGMSNQGNLPQSEMNPTNVNSASENGSEIITGEVKPNLSKVLFTEVEVVRQIRQDLVDCTYTLLKILPYK